jgi:hypothetical protein
LLEAEKYNFTKVNPVVQFLIFVSVFVSSIVFFKEPFEGYLHYIVFLTFIPVFAVRYGYPKYLAKILVFLAAVGFLNVGIGVYPMFGFIKVWGGLFLSVTFYHYVLRYYEFNIVQIFKVYGTWSFYVCLIGIIQLVSYRLGIGIGYDYSWLFNKWGITEGGLVGIRVNSIFSEPSTLAAVIAPAAYFSVYNLIHKDNFIVNKKQAIVILITYVLASSSTAYLALLVIIFLVTDSLKLRYVLIGTIASIGLFAFMYSKSEDFRIRVDTSQQLWIYQNYSLENTNSSSFVLYNGFIVATSNLSEFPVFGSGLGSYEQAYEKHSLTKSVLNYDFEFNTTDGNSSLIRLTVETGIVGVVLFLFLVFKCFIPKKGEQEEIHFRLISQAIFVMIMVYLLRQGNYFLNAFPFFVMMYYFNWKNYKLSVKDK